MSARTLYVIAFLLLLLPLGIVLVMLGDQRLLLLARNSLLLAGATSLLALPLGTLLAVLIARTDVPGRAIAAGVIAALIFLPLYLHYAGWDAGVGARGWITAAVGRPLAEPLLAGWRGAILIHALAAIPWVCLIVGLGLSGVEPSLEQEALQDSSPLVVFFRVTLPRSWQWLVVALLWIVVTVTAEMQITDMYQVRTYAEEIYLGFALGEEIQAASYSTLGQIGLIGSMVVIAMATVAFLSPRSAPSDDRPRLLFPLGRFRPLTGLLLWLLLLAMLGMPLANLMAQAGIQVTRSGEQIERSWSLLKALQLLPVAVVEYRREIGWSFLMGGVAATVCLIVAAPLAWLARRSRLFTAMLILLAAIGLAVPGPLVGVGIISLFNDPPVPLLHWLYNQSIAAPVLAMTFKALPLVLLLLWRAMHRVADELVESASVEGASLLQRLSLIGMASQWPTLAAAWLLGMAVGMGELAGSILTTPPQVETMTIRIFGLAHAGVDDQLAALCLVGELIFLSLAAVVYGVLRRVSPTR